MNFFQRFPAFLFSAPVFDADDLEGTVTLRIGGVSARRPCT